MQKRKWVVLAFSILLSFGVLSAQERGGEKLRPRILWSLPSPLPGNGYGNHNDLASVLGRRSLNYRFGKFDLRFGSVPRTYGIRGRYAGPYQGGVLPLNPGMNFGRPNIAGGTGGGGIGFQIRW